MLGKVKWFNEERGYGFIVGDDNKDYFAHVSEIKTNGFKDLIEGQPVEFEPSENEKGLLAKSITVQE